MGRAGGGGGTNRSSTHAPRWSDLETKRSTTMSTHRRRGRRWKGMAPQNGPSRVTKHLSLLLDGKLTCRLRCSDYVIFWLRDLIAKFKNTKSKNMAFFAEIAKFYLQNFPVIRYYTNQERGPGLLMLH